MEQEYSNKYTNEKTSPALIAICSLTVVMSIVLACLFFCGRKNGKVADENFSAIEHICELATLKCFYHDVAEYKKESNASWKIGNFQYGYKKFWIEYDGIVTVGINAGKVRVEKPDNKGVVKVHIPPAMVLDVDVDEWSMRESAADTGLFTSITVAEQAETFAQAQNEMKNKAQADNSLITQAQKNAEALINNYIIGVGKLIGKEYKVEWIHDDI